jgi:acetyl esterase/lipase
MKTTRAHPSQGFHLALDGERWSDVPFDPEIAALLAAADQDGSPALHELPPTEARAKAIADIDGLVGQPDPGVSAEEVAIPGPAGEIGATLYRPDRPLGTQVLLFIHGGGWLLGSRATHDVICRLLGGLSGVYILSIDYRLAPENPFPSAVHDCWAATEWLVDNAKQLGLDPPHIAIGGDSAGGNLAAVTALRARDEGIDLACQFLLYPAVDAQLDTESARRLSDGYGLSSAEMRYFWSQYLGSAGEASDPKASPLRASNLAGVAPAVVVTAEYDILRDEAEQYAARLISEGVPVTSWRARGMPHAFLNYRAVSPGAAGTYEVCAGLLAKAIASPGGTP